LSLSIGARKRNAVLLKLKRKTLVKMVQFAVYFEVTIKIKAGDIGATNTQYHPPVCQELACSRLAIFYHKIGSISPLANSRHKRESELALCPLPHHFPNRIACCLKPAQPYPPHLVFFVVRPCHLLRLRGDKQCYQQETINEHVLCFAVSYDG
jgi:hypothetical protein